MAWVLADIRVFMDCVCIGEGSSIAVGVGADPVMLKAPWPSPHYPRYLRPHASQAHEIRLAAHMLADPFAALVCLHTGHRYFVHGPVTTIVLDPSTDDGSGVPTASALSRGRQVVDLDQVGTMEVCLRPLGPHMPVQASLRGRGSGGAASSCASMRDLCAGRSVA